MPQDRNLVGRIDRLLIGLAIAVASSLVFMLAYGVAAQPGEESAQPAGSTEPTEAPTEPVETADSQEPQPGVPNTPVDEQPTWPDVENQNADRQLDTNSEIEGDFETAPSDDLTGYWNQTLEWSDCGEDQCTQMLVPLDWENPGAGALKIAVRKVPSENPTNGPLFVNPGGPGFGGQSFASSLGSDRWEGYDIIGWDPRGTGESTPVECGSFAETDDYFNLDGSPDDDVERDELIAGNEAFSNQCRSGSQDLLEHLSTVENVRDLDLLRYLLGAEKLNYVGVSYGTYVGAMYAQLFGDRAGRLVLDAPVEITDAEGVSQIEGFELAFTNFATWCGEDSGCDLGESANQVKENVAQWLADLDGSPLQVADRELTQTKATTGILTFLYSEEDLYPTLAEVLERALAGDGYALLMSADQLDGRTDSGYDLVTYAFPATLCVDWPDQGIDAAFEYEEEVDELAPMLGPNAGMSLLCETWTAPSVPLIKITAPEAPTILVLGSTGDSATPYEQAQSMAEQLEDAVLVTREGAGHGSVTSDNACVSEIVDEYLGSGQAPDEDQTCS